MDVLRRAFERVLGGHGGPTSDLYFANACGDALASGQVVPLSPTVLMSDSALLVLRHGAGVDLEPVLSGRRLIWLIDDDIMAGVADPDLSLLHRLKLASCERAFARRYRDRIQHVVVSSNALASTVLELAPHAEIATLGPYWSEPFADHTHFDRVATDAQTIDIGCLGARTHKADLAPYWTALGDVLHQYPHVHLWVSANHKLPPALARCPRCHTIIETGWQAYRASIGQRRFHLLAYPLRDMAFNRARSVNKIIEHAVLGGAGLYSHTWPEAGQIAAAKAGLVLGDEPDDWRAALCDQIEDLIGGGSRTMALARAGRDLAQRLNDRPAQRVLWARLMDLDLDPAGGV
ncbi:MAG: hypothetical protein AAFV19_06765 [Pseudomonadota bacterium]